MRREKEQETSSGALIGYGLIALAVVFIVMFIIFAVVKSGDNKDTKKIDNKSTAYYEISYDNNAINEI